MRSSKTLGIIFCDNPKREQHIQYICDKASSWIWIFQKLIEMRIDSDFILDCYFKEICRVLEYGAVIYHSVLTKRQSNVIESIQRKVFYIIDIYINIKLSYSESCILYCAEKLEEKRLGICLTFIKRSLKNPGFNGMFEKKRRPYDVSGNQHRFK